MKQKKLARMLALLTSVFLMAGETLPALAAGTDAADAAVVAEDETEEAQDDTKLQEEENEEEVQEAVTPAEADEEGEEPGSGEEPDPGESEEEHKVSCSFRVNTENAARPEVEFLLGGKVFTFQEGGMEVECELCHKKLRAFLFYTCCAEGVEARCNEPVMQRWEAEYELIEEGKEPQHCGPVSEELEIPATGLHSYLRDSRCIPDWWWDDVDGEWRPIASMRCWECGEEHAYRMENEEMSVSTKEENGITRYTATLSFDGAYDPESGKADRTVTFSNTLSTTANGFTVFGADDVFYTGKALKCERLEVRYGREHRLQEGVDYSVKYTNNKNAGTATLTVTGKGKFKGSISQDFNILPKNIADDCFYAPELMLLGNGKAQKATPALYEDGVPVPKKFYSVDFNDAGNYTDPGFYEATIKAKGPNYTGSRKYGIDIFDKAYGFTDIKKVKVQLKPEYFTMTQHGFDWEKYEERDENGVRKAYTVTYNGKDVTGLFERADLMLDEEGGKGFIVIFADPGRDLDGVKFAGTVTQKVKLAQKDIKDLKLINLPDELEWNIWGYNVDTLRWDMGVTFLDGEEKLNPNEDYDLSVKGGNKTGTMTVTFTGRRAYCGKLVKKVKLVAKDMEKEYKAGHVFAGVEIGFDEEKDQPIVEQPEYIPYAKGGARFEWLTAGLYIENSWEEDGEVQTRTTHARLEEGKDFTVKYTNNAKVGDKATVIFSFRGNYRGTVSFDATVGERNIDPYLENGMDLLVNDVVLPKKAPGNMKPFIAKVEMLDRYTGKKLKENVDYTLKYYRSGGEGEEDVEIKAADPYAEVKLGDHFYVVAEAKEGSGYTGSCRNEYHVVEKYIKASDVKVKDQVIMLNQRSDYEERGYFAPLGFNWDGPDYFDVWGCSDEEYAAWAANYFEKVPEGCRVDLDKTTIKNGSKVGKTAGIRLRVIHSGREGETYVYGGYTTVKFKVVAMDLVKN